MNRATVCVSGLLAVSVVLNIVLMVRGREHDPEGTAARTSRPLRQDPAGTEPLSAAPSTPRIDRVGEHGASPGPVAKSVSSAAPAVVLPSRSDPRVARIIDEEEEFRAFWQDLARVFGVREKLEPEEYHRVVLSSTADFLRLQEPARSQFLAEVRVAVAERVQAQKEFEDLKRTIAKDKPNPAVYAPARQQLETVLQAKLKSSEARIGSLLDPTPGRHREFAAKLPKWLKELEPLTP